MAKKNIVVVGGGYAGIGIINKLENALPNTHRIVLIEQQDFMYIRLAAARAASSEDIAEQVLVPYDKLFKSPETGIVVKASVKKINPHSVVLSAPHKTFGSEIEFDYLVMATGSDWKDPIDLHTTSRNDAIAILAKKRAEVAAAKDIIIIGAGPVGIELSGEIKMAHPEMNVTIVHGARLPLSDVFPEYFREKAVAMLGEFGVKIILNEKVDTESISEKGGVRLKSGETMPADIVLFAIGATPRGEIIRSLSPALYNSSTHSIRVNEKLQVDNSAYPYIFAAGDVADTPDLKMAYKAGLHAPIVAKNIISLLNGQAPTAIYQPKTGSEMITLPMGKNGGVSYLSFFGGFTLGNWGTKTLKGKGLFIGAGRKLLRY